MVDYLYGDEKFKEYTVPTQVYQATHDGIGRRLSLRDRSFISFTYGGKVIEDFGLIAYTEGDAIDKEIYSNFEDITETYDVVDGQIYWGTHFTGNELTLNLVTDALTERDLDNFKHWFSPGVARELVLAEHPNRAIMARVSAPPKMSLLPFEHKVEKLLAGQLMKTSITLYKGTIELTFIADEPFWYSRYNLFVPALYGEGLYGIIDVTQEPEKLKILLDGIGADQRNLIVKYEKEDNSGNKYASYEEYMRVSEMRIDKEHGYWTLHGTTWTVDESTGHTIVAPPVFYSYPSQIRGAEGKIISLAGRAVTWPDNDSSHMDEGKDYIKMIIEDNIPHIKMFQSNEPILLGENLGTLATDALEESRIFNPYSYPYPPNTVNPLKAHRGAHVTYYGWIGFDYNVYFAPVELKSNNPQYLFYAGTAPSKPVISFKLTPTFDNVDGLIKFPGNKKAGTEYTYIALDDYSYFYFTTPALLTGYNQALELVHAAKAGETLLTDLITQLRERINEYYVRAWALKCVNENPNISSNGIIIDGFYNDFREKMRYFFEDTPQVSFSFDSKTGKALGFYRVKDANLKDFINIAENVGDMVKSDFLIIEGRNYPNAAGFITKQECHKITTNAPALEEFSITYKNMYY